MAAFSRRWSISPPTGRWCKKLGRGVPTIDMRVDYHAAAMPGDLTSKGKVVRMGGQFSAAEASIFDAQGKLLASGRGTYFTAPPPPTRR